MIEQGLQQTGLEIARQLPLAVGQVLLAVFELMHSGFSLVTRFTSYSSFYLLAQAAHRLEGLEQVTAVLVWTKFTLQVLF